MGKLYAGCQQVIREIDTRGLDPLRTRGAIALRTGFLVSLIEPSDPDDPEKIEALKKAAHEVLGTTLNI